MILLNIKTRHFFTKSKNLNITKSTVRFNSNDLIQNNKIKLFDQEYQTDEWTNITRNIHEKLNRNLLHQKYHPLNHLANKIKYFFYKNYVNRSGTPLFSIYDQFKPIVTVDQNFDRFLLVF
jgi:hypothetical protein